MNQTNNKLNIGIIGTLVTIIITMFVYYQFYSEDPREKLNKLGVSWNADNFLDSIRLGDLKTIELFLEGEMSPYVVNTEKFPLAVQIAANKTNPDQVLNLLIKHIKDFDINHVYKKEPYGGFTIIDQTLEFDNFILLKSLVENGIDLSKKVEFRYQGFGYSFVKFQDTPLNYCKEKLEKYGKKDNREEIVNFLKEKAPGSDSEKPVTQTSSAELQMQMDDFEKKVSNDAMMMMQNW